MFHYHQRQCCCVPVGVTGVAMAECFILFVLQVLTTKTHLPLIYSSMV